MMCHPERAQRVEGPPAQERTGFLDSPLIRPSGTFSPHGGEKGLPVVPSPRLRGEGGPFGSAQGKLRPGEGAERRGE
jgi:hypothetical protein